jgi:photosystem II stability/assembly factor-like uncharacterized protein
MNFILRILALSAVILAADLLASHTLDAQEWRTVYNSNDNFLDIQFPDTDHGTAVGLNGVILHTTNSGVTWTPQSLPGIVSLNGVSFVNANIGWVAGTDGALFHTTDGGASWYSQSNWTSFPISGV